MLFTNNIVTSKSEGRRAIKDNGLKINGKIITEDKKILNLDDFDNEKFVKISFGKKKHYLLKII